MDFIFGHRSAESTLEDVLKQFTGYESNRTSNITIIDLSGIPFELLSITISLISRLMFDFCYYERKLSENIQVPFLMVYEEAHKYAPRNGSARYKAALSSIERIAKEGRKYGISLLISSQRPSEISETIFSQCSNFLAMRLTNPDDQSYVKRLLPDTLGNIIDGIPALEQGEAILIGDSVMRRRTSLHPTEMPDDAVPVPPGGAGARVRHTDAACDDAGVPGRSSVRLPRPPVHGDATGAGSADGPAGWVNYSVRWTRYRSGVE